ncbi:AEC family transporter [Pseudohalocynthiibacter aestuariivivens]|uniref:AEC family transporter n=1 Tax=Roseovarius pelagicus TaxID=2980108 RepID=A0ABY6DAP7_9RHOB|nr:MULTISPECIES: AEC family transporter [Rhodobacterales]QIE44861.1 AEC family transporter [Pseudohalocynthiibacter aestuariivivens]UXX83232.1 AEC family transporter [Roseovarius pelagicus]
MQALLDVILPVFVVIGAGYLAVWLKWFPQTGVDGLMKFTQNFAIPCLLFTALSRLDLGQGFDWRLLLSFYTGALAGFVLGLFGARLIFGRTWEDAIVIGFCCLFSNSVLLGLPLTERAYGADALTSNYAIIALHSPFCYGVGISVMEITRARGAAGVDVAQRVLKAMFTNALIIGIGLGLLVNLTGLTLPGTVQAGLDLIARAALPAALFGLGGVLVQYRPEGDLRVIGWVCLIALVAHPLITRTLGGALVLDNGPMRSAVLTAAMAPGANAYIFANMYGRAKRVAASAVLFGTGLSILSAWVWMGLLP